MPDPNHEASRPSDTGQTNAPRGRVGANDAAETVKQGKGVLGVELGSTRIKAVLIGPDHRVLAVGVHDWENEIVDGVWTYSLDAVWSGLQRCYRTLADEVHQRHGVDLTRVRALGVSAMMHGYLAFDGDDQLLTPFRTWRNTNTSEAARRLSAALGVNIPHRWSAAHLYQAALDGEPHARRVAHLTTLGGYVHWQLTGRRVLGVGDASGMFPIDSATRNYDAAMLVTFDRLTAEAGVRLRLVDLLPAVQVAGQPAGELTEAGARLLDPAGQLQPGAVMCPPEGDAGTGMVATNTVAPATGNVSAGTSIFAMVVLDQPLRAQHPELDLVTTPVGDAVAMVHCNNGASELDAWIGLFIEFAATVGSEVSAPDVFEALLRTSLDGAPDCDGLLSYSYLAGEPITAMHEGRPLFTRTPGSRFDLSTFIRTHLFASLATLRVGMDVLQREERVRLDRLFAHGGLFKTKGVAQRFLAAALCTTVTVGEAAGEGGAWGIALLAQFCLDRAHGEDLPAYLANQVFSAAVFDSVEPDAVDVAGFDEFMRRFINGLPVEQAAVAHS